MKHIIKAELYQLRHTKIFYIMIGVLLLLQLLGVFGYVINHIPGDAWEMIASVGFRQYLEIARPIFLSGSEYVAECEVGVFLYAIAFVGIAVGILCVGDYQDKTANYELMGGYTRLRCFAAHSILGIMMAVIGAELIAFFPVVLMSVLFGWGDALSFWQVLGRYGLAVFPLFRLSCVMVCISYFLRNSYLMIVLGYITSVGTSILYEFTSEGNSLLLSVTNLRMLESYKGWGIYQITDLEAGTIYCYDAVLSPESIIKTMVVSCVVGGTLLFIGYSYFRKEDL